MASRVSTECNEQNISTEWCSWASLQGWLLPHLSFDFAPWLPFHYQNSWYIQGIGLAPASESRGRQIENTSNSSHYLILLRKKNQSWPNAPVIPLLPGLRWRLFIVLCNLSNQESYSACCCKEFHLQHDWRSEVKIIGGQFSPISHPNQKQADDLFICAATSHWKGKGLKGGLDSKQARAN